MTLCSLCVKFGHYIGDSDGVDLHAMSWMYIRSYG